MSAAQPSRGQIDPGLPDWAKSFAEKLLRAVDFHRWAGLELVTLAPGRAELAFAAEERLLVPGGYIHGGILNGLLEPPGLLAMLGHMREDETAMTLDIHVQHLRPIAAGARVGLIGRMLRRGRNVAFCECEARINDQPCTIAHITKTIQTKAV
jgi:uncharacterized protein (TIGR00369 family)